MPDIFHKHERLVKHKVLIQKTIQFQTKSGQKIVHKNHEVAKMGNIFHICKSKNSKFYAQL